MGEGKKESSEKGPEILAYIALGILILAAIVPAAIGAGAFWIVRDKIKRMHYVIALVIGLILSVVLLMNGELLRTGTWILAIFGAGDGSVLSFPIFSLVSTSLFFFGLFGTVGVTLLSKLHPVVADTLGAPSVDGVIDIDPDSAGAIAQMVMDSPELGEGTRSTAPTALGDPDSSPIYMGIDGKKQKVYLYTGDISTHGIILGTTGTGKTESIKRLLGGLLDLGWSGCVLDLKEDIGAGGLAHFCEAYSAAHGVEYQHWALSYTEPEFKFYLDPMVGIDVDRAKNMIISMQDFEAPHWEMLCKQVLGQLLDVMYLAHDIAPEKFAYPTLRDVGQILASDVHDETQGMRAVVLSALKGTGQRDEGDFHTLAKPSKDHVTASKGLGARISAAYESHAGRTGLKAGLNRDPIRLSDQGIIYIGLDQMGQPDTSMVVSSSILAGYNALASRRKDDARVKSKLDRRFLIVDEAASANTDMIKNLLSRARSAGIAVILATQGAVDWEDEWNTMVNNTNFSILMGQQDIISATLAAELIGKDLRIDESLSLDDGIVTRTTQREVDDFRVNPERIRQLPKGQTYIRVRDRYGSNEPYTTWCFVQMRLAETTVSGHTTSVEDRTISSGTAPWLNALPDFTNPDLAPPPGFASVEEPSLAQPTQSTQPPAPQLSPPTGASRRRRKPPPAVDTQKIDPPAKQQQQRQNLPKNDTKKKSADTGDGWTTV